MLFASLAGIYALLGNPLIAATQVLVYIGAISVLILFAIMLTQTKNAPVAAGLPDPGLGRRSGRCVIAIVISAAVLATTWQASSQRVSTNTTDVAHKLFADYVLPFEVVSVLLTAAVVGAVFLARREVTRPEEDRS